MTIRLAPFAFSLRLAPAFALRWRALGALVLGLALGLAARADTEGEFTYTVDGETATITEYSGDGLGLSIPTTLGGKRVTAIGPDTFSRRLDRIEVLAIPEGVTAIGERAFAANWRLKIVTLPAGLSTLADGAFADCADLRAAIFLGNAPTMGAGVFLGAPEDFAVHYSRKRWGFTTPKWQGYPCSVEYAPLIVHRPRLQWNSATNDLDFQVAVFGSPSPSIQWQRNGRDIPGATGTSLAVGTVQAVNTGRYRVVALNSYGIATSDSEGLSLAGENNFTYIVDGDTATVTGYPYQPFSSISQKFPPIPESLAGLPVTAIEPHAFPYLWDIEGTLSIPTGVTTIGEYAFAGCSLSGQLVLPDRLVTIGRSAFSECRGFRGPLTIPSDVAAIGESAFDSCGALAGDLTIEGDTTTIGARAFAGHAGLTFAYFLGNAPSTFGAEVFAGAASDFAIYYRSGATGFTTPRWQGYRCFVATAPSIALQPAAQNVVERDTATFTVKTAGGPPPAIRWQKDGVDIPGATGPTLTLARVRAEQAGRYRAVAANALGSVESASAPLTVNPTPVPVIDKQSNHVLAVETQDVSLSVTAVGATRHQWYRNGRPVANGAESVLKLAWLQPSDVGIYDCVLEGDQGSTLSAPMIVGLEPNGRIVSAVWPPPDKVYEPLPRVAGNIATKPEWQNVRTADGKTIDQFLLTGLAGTITAEPDQISRLSFVDLNDTLVQVELSGQGALTVVLDESTASGPAEPLLYRSSGVRYMKGKATLVLGGTNETTHFTVYSVGTANNPAVTRSDVAYLGWAEIAVAGILSWNGKLGGLRLGNVAFTADSGYTGLYAPSVKEVGDPAVVHGINATGSALPYLYFAPEGSVEVAIAGSSLQQDSGDPIATAGLAKVKMVAGQDSCGRTAPAQAIRAQLLDPDGTNITRTVVEGP